MANTSEKTVGRMRRHGRVRAKISGTAERPRLSVFRSNKAITAQIIDDVAGKTLASVRSTSSAEEVGTAIAEEAKKQGITMVVFDRGGFLYRGKVQQVAESARNAGLSF